MLFPSSDSCLEGLPANVQWALTCSLAPDTTRSLMGVSRACRDLVLKHADVKLCLILDTALPVKPVLQLRQALLGPLADRALKLAVMRAAPLQWSCAKRTVADLFYLSCQALQSPLVSLVHIELMGLTLDNLVPDCITQSCPNMTSLVLNCCTLRDLPEPSTPVPKCPQLKQLSIRISAAQPRLEAERLEHQFRTLPNLNSVTLNYLDMQWRRCVSSLSSVGTQLTHLALNDRLGLIGDPERLGQWFPVLRELDLRQARVCDAEMDVLLGLHTLKSVTVWSFELTRSYAGVRAMWEHVGMRMLRVAVCALLPLEGVQRLEMICPSPSSSCSSSPPIHLIPAWATGSAAAGLELTTAALENVNRCGGIYWPPDAHVVINGAVAVPPGVVGPVAPAHMLLTATMPLLSRVQRCHLEIQGLQPVTPALVESIGTMVGCHSPQDGLVKLTFKDCSWDASVSLSLLPSLPRCLETLVLDWHNPCWQLPEAFLAAMCSQAVRGVTLEVNACGLEPGWRERLGQAMHEAGHEQLIQVLEVQSPPPDPDWISRLFFVPQ